MCPWIWKREVGEMPRDRCENCGRPTPGRWMCDECMMVYDGDRFHSEMLPDGYLDFDEEDEDEQ